VLIEELSAGQAIKLQAKIGEEIIEFESLVQDSLPRKHAILADVVRKKRKSFPSSFMAS